MSSLSDFRSPVDLFTWGKLLAFGIQIISRIGVDKIYYPARLTGFDPMAHL